MGVIVEPKAIFSEFFECHTTEFWRLQIVLIVLLIVKLLADLDWLESKWRLLK